MAVHTVLLIIVASSYLLEVMISDNGNPSRTANTTVNITVLDVNDNLPMFTNLPLATPLKIKEVIYK